MATLAISLDAGAQSRSVSKTVSGAHLTRFIAAYRSILGQVDDGQGGQRDMTDEEVFDAWAGGIFDGTKANVLRAEQDTAKVAAEAAVSEISLADA